MERLNLKINGMSCGHCVSAVRKALDKTAGLKVVDVAVGSAIVEVQDAVTGGAAARSAVTGAGYEIEGVTVLSGASAPKQGSCCCGNGKCA